MNQDENKIQEINEEELEQIVGGVSRPVPMQTVRSGINAGGIAGFARETKSNE